MVGDAVTGDSGTFLAQNVPFYFIVVHLLGPVIADHHNQGCLLEFIHAVCFQTFMADMGGLPGFVSSP